MERRGNFASDFTKINKTTLKYKKISKKLNVPQMSNLCMQIHAKKNYYVFLF